MSVDFIALNIVGFSALVTSTALLVLNQGVRELYFKEHNYYPLLTMADLIYSTHGLLLTLVYSSQLCLWGFRKRSIVLRRSTKLIISGVLVICFLLYSIIGTNTIHQYTEDEQRIYTLLDLAITLSYLKMMISLIKYIPQLSHNIKRRSVVGFSMLTIFLDLTGSVLSISQLFIDSYIATNSINYDVLINNGGKLGLSFVTMFFGACFVYQFYKYGNKSEPISEKV